MHEHSNNMFSKVHDFLSRHKRKFLVGGVVIGGVLFLTHYTQKKIREWQEKEIKELLERIKRRQYFESTEKTCNCLIQTCVSSLRKSIVKFLDTETIVNRLRAGSADKVSAWNELKVLAISRSAVMIYSQVMLVTFIKIQFNLMGAYRYKHSGQLSKTAVVNDCDESYLSLCSHFLTIGIKRLCNLIEEKVKEITSSISLKNELSLRDLEQIYWAVISSVSADSTQDPIQNIASYMMLPTYCQKDTDIVMPTLITETLDLLECEEVQNLLQSNIRTGFVLLVDHISEYFINTTETTNFTGTQNSMFAPQVVMQPDTTLTDANVPSNHHPLNNFIDVHKVTMPMAKIIPIINGQVPDKATLRDVPSDWLQRLITNDELRSLGANIYEAFSF